MARYKVRSKEEVRQDREDQRNKLRSLYTANNFEGLAKEVTRMQKQLNQRYYRLEKAGLEQQSYSYKLSQERTGKEKPRYSQTQAVVEKDYTYKIGSKNVKDIQGLYMNALDINLKLNTNSSTIGGVKSITNMRLSTATDTLNSKLGNNSEITAQELSDFLSAGGGEFFNNKYLDSTQIIEDFVDATRGGLLTTEEFINIYKGYKAKTFKRKDIVDLLQKKTVNLLSKKVKQKSRNQRKKK